MRVDGLDAGGLGLGAGESSLLAGAVFVAGAAMVGVVYLAMLSLPAALERRRLARRLRDVSAGDRGSGAADSVLKTPREGPWPFLDRLANRLRPGVHVRRLIEQAGVDTSVSGIVLWCGGCGAALAAAAGVTAQQPWAPAVAGLVGSILPLAFLRLRRQARIRRFEQRFPEALDLLARAIRAGHAFTTGMGMVADEAPEPVGPEFRTVFDEQNFGLPLKDALGRLAERMPLLDVRFFTTAVLIQRETGGNLAEILENLAHVVRERFKILRQVRVHTAHGRLTGYVLMGLPPALAVTLTAINPEHMRVLFNERLGQQMLLAAVVMQAVGYLWIRRVVKIEV